MKTYNIEKTNSQGELVTFIINNIRKKQSTFLGHVMRRVQLQWDATRRKLEGKMGAGKTTADDAARRFLQDA